MRWWQDLLTVFWAILSDLRFFDGHTHISYCRLAFGVFRQALMVGLPMVFNILQNIDGFRTQVVDTNQDLDSDSGRLWADAFPRTSF